MTTNLNYQHTNLKHIPNCLRNKTMFIDNEYSARYESNNKHTEKLT